jgi:hypothetical protein
MKRAHFLKQAEQTICRDRQDIHGKPENTFALIAQYWSTFLSEESEKQITLCGADVAAMMTLFKIARMQINPFHEDNIVDGIGYLAIAGELIDDIAGSDELLNDK